MNADQLRALMARLPDPDPTGVGKPPANPPWLYFRRALWQTVVDGASPQDFMAWPTVYHNFLVNHLTEAITTELAVLQAAPDWARWQEAIEMPHVGSPPDWQPGTTYSRNLIAQATHLYEWERVTGRKVADLSSILEFGAGYGALALVAHRLGFRGDYYIFDFLEVGLLSQWFLSQVAVPITHIAADEPGPAAVDLLVACYSLNEAPLADRQAFLTRYPARSYLFAYSHPFEGLDNVAFYAELRQTLPTWSWQDWHIPQYAGESRYCIGSAPAAAAPAAPRPPRAKRKSA